MKMGGGARRGRGGILSVKNFRPILYCERIQTKLGEGYPSSGDPRGTK